MQILTHIIRGRSRGGTTFALDSIYYVYNNIYYVVTVNIYDYDIQDELRLFPSNFTCVRACACIDNALRTE